VIWRAKTIAHRFATASMRIDNKSILEMPAVLPVAYIAVAMPLQREMRILRVPVIWRDWLG
jgi:hypothetical protein